MSFQIAAICCGVTSLKLILISGYVSSNIRNKEMKIKHCQLTLFP